MNKKLFAVAAVAVVFAALNLASRAAQEGPARAPLQALVTPATCLQPQWPAEARRYEIEGLTTISFGIGADGAVVRPAIVRGSGWRILDEAAIHSISQCRFAPDLPAARDGTAFPLQYVWKLDGAPPVRPLLVAGSCQPSQRFAAFREADPRPSGKDGILLRFLLNAEGAPVRVVAEAGGQPQELVAEAVAYLQTCRFAYDPARTGERTDTAYGRVLLQAPAI
ncbi:TonB family protein [Duganella sp. SG902]|uniref:energy transducer TonB n=1 Tax=Duganella sp. SG902 TaxID=2587016 RepID=UPI00159DDD8A|nr:energy transducer TonB [Duganella sp. SG902]NVM75194.1 TonB family protein [Duganella sp. SG902]